MSNRQKRKTKKLLVEIMLTGAGDNHDMVWGSYAYDADLIRMSATDGEWNNKWELTDKGRKYLEQHR